ncbi:hypothetical protein [Marmoricola sp. URHA0025 HA25]
MSATIPTSRDQHASSRWLLVGAVTAAAAAHIPVIGPHLEEAPYMGVLFVLLTGACLAIGATVAVADATWAYRAALPVCGAAVVGYAATRLVAFPQLADDVGNWFEPLGVVSVVTESAVVLLAALVLRGRSAGRH